ncbi:MAG: hypothetical protein ACFFCP_18180 [Promethearchaeota archaeon]
MEEPGRPGKVPLNAHEIQHISSILRAIAHTKRIEILNVLSLRSTDYTTLLRRSRTGRTALATHLASLTKERLIRRTSRGRYEFTQDGYRYLQSIIDAYSKSQTRIELEPARVATQYYEDLLEMVKTT